MVKLKEMTAGGSGATIGPIQPLGVDKESVEEMLRRNDDLQERHIAAFAAHSDYFDRHELRLAERFGSYSDMGDIVRECLVRATVRQRMHEVVRKKDGKYILYAPNTGKKHAPKPVAIFSTKLAAKRAELAKFPPKDPQKLERLKKQIEKLLKDPKARAKEILMKERVDRDLFETALMSIVVCRDVERCLMNERLFRGSKPKGDEYTGFIRQFSRRAIDSDPDFKGEQEKYEKTAAEVLARRVKELEGELGMQVKSGEPKRHTDGKLYVAISLVADCEVKPIYLYADGPKVKCEFSAEAKAALTKCKPETADKIRSRLGSLNEEDVGDDPQLAGAYDGMVGRTRKVYQFVDEFLSRLSPLAMTILKRLLAKKYRKLGATS